MKVILLETVDRLGKIGDVVTVTEGYARNWLIPNKKARPATSGNLKLLEALKKKERLEENKKLEEAKSLAQKLSNLSLTIGAEAGEEEKLFGSVSNDTIADHLAEDGIMIDKKDIVIDEPIKKLGVYQVMVKIHPLVKAALRVWVVKK